MGPRVATWGPEGQYSGSRGPCQPLPFCQARSNNGVQATASSVRYAPAFSRA